MEINRNLVYFVKFKFKGNGIFTKCCTGEDIKFTNGEDYNNLNIGEYYELVYDEKEMFIHVVGGMYKEVNEKPKLLDEKIDVFIKSTREKIKEIIKDYNKYFEKDVITINE